MDLLNTTIDLATKAVKTDATIKETTTINRDVLTKIMTDPKMIRMYNPSTNQQRIDYIKMNFNSFYKYTGVKAGQPVTLNDGINTLKYLIHFINETLAKSMDQGSSQRSSQLNNNNNQDNVNQQHDYNNFNDNFDIDIENIGGSFDNENFEMNDRLSSNPFGNDSNHLDAPLSKRQRQVGEKNVDSLQDQLVSKFSDSVKDMVNKINNRWHDENNELSNKYQSLQPLSPKYTSYTNSEAIFDSHYNESSRDKVKQLIDQYIDEYTNKYSEQTNTNDCKEDTNGNDNKQLNENNNNQNNHNSNQNSPMKNEKEFKHSDPQVEIPPTLQSLIAEFMSNNRSYIDDINHETNIKKILSPILDLVINFLHDFHQRRQNELLFPNNTIVNDKPPVLNLKHGNDKLEALTKKLKLNYHHCVFGHSTTNKVYALINIITMTQIICDQMDLIWTTNNKIMDNSTSCTKSLRLVKSQIENFELPLHTPQEQNNKKDKNPEKNKNSDSNTNNNKENKKNKKPKHKDKTKSKTKKDNSQKNKGKAKKSNTKHKHNNNNEDSASGSSSNDEESGSERDQGGQDRNSDDEFIEEQLVKIEGNLEKVTTNFTVMNKNITDGGKIVSEIREMINIMIDILYNLINGAIDDSIGYFCDLQYKGAIMSYIIFELIKGRIESFNEERATTAQSIEKFQHEVNDYEKTTSNLTKNMQQQQKQLDHLQQENQHLKNLVQEKEDEIDKRDLMELAKMAQQQCGIDNQAKQQQNQNGQNNNDSFQNDFEHLSPIATDQRFNMHLNIESSFLNDKNNTDQNRPHTYSNFKGHKNINNGHNGIESGQMHNILQNTNNNANNNSNHNGIQHSTLLTMSQLPGNYDVEFIYTREIDPINLDVVTTMPLPKGGRMNTSQMVEYFEKQGANLATKVYHTGRYLDESWLQFYVGKWTNTQRIQNYWIVHGYGDDLRSRLYENYYSANAYDSPNKYIYPLPNHHQIMQVDASNESKQQFEQRLMIGQPDLVSLLQYEPMGKNFNLPIFIKYMNLTQEQINTLTIKITDKKFCGNPNNANDLSHYQRLETLIAYVPNFWHYFIYCEFKIWLNQENRNNSQKSNNNNNTKFALIRELYLYPRPGKATEGEYAILNAIQFIPKVTAFFDKPGKPYFQFANNFRDRMTICERIGGKPNLFIIPRTLYFYHKVFRMHDKGDGIQKSNNSQFNGHQMDTQSNNMRNNEMKINNRYIIAIRYINKMFSIERQKHRNNQRQQQHSFSQQHQQQQTQRNIIGSTTSRGQTDNYISSTNNMGHPPTGWQMNNGITNRGGINHSDHPNTNTNGSNNNWNISTNSNMNSRNNMNSSKNINVNNDNSQSNSDFVTTGQNTDRFGFKSYNTNANQNMGNPATISDMWQKGGQNPNHYGNQNV